LAYSCVGSGLQLEREDGVAAALLHLYVFKAAAAKAALCRGSARFGNDNVITVAAAVGRIVVEGRVCPDGYARALRRVGRSKRSDFLLLRLLLRGRIRITLLLRRSPCSWTPSSQLSVRFGDRREYKDQEDKQKIPDGLHFQLGVREGHHVHYVFSALMGRSFDPHYATPKPLSPDLKRKWVAVVHWQTGLCIGRHLL
jgi:hypothetical protein